MHIRGTHTGECSIGEACQTVANEMSSPGVEGHRQIPFALGIKGSIMFVYRAEPRSSNHVNLKCFICYTQQHGQQSHAHLPGASSLCLSTQNPSLGVNLSHQLSGQEETIQQSSKKLLAGTPWLLQSAGLYRF